MLVAGFDTETTGLDVEKDHIIQLGAVLWDTKATTKKAKIKLDVLIHDDSIPELTEEVTGIHGITNNDLVKYGVTFKVAFDLLHDIFKRAELIVAHNGTLFDKPIYVANCLRQGITPVTEGKQPTLWADTYCDIEYPTHIQTRKLTHLAAEHGFINPFPHDALCDVMTMLKLADLYSWDEIVRYALAPTLIVKAEVTFSQKDLAKKQGFKWNADTKLWLKSIKEFQFFEAKRAAADVGFKLSVQKGAK